jgi:hypothetical protein
MLIAINNLIQMLKYQYYLPLKVLSKLQIYWFISINSNKVQNVEVYLINTIQKVDIHNFCPSFLLLFQIYFFQPSNFKLKLLNLSYNFCDSSEIMYYILYPFHFNYFYHLKWQINIITLKLIRLILSFISSIIEYLTRFDLKYSKHFSWVYLSDFSLTLLEFYEDI